MKHVIIGNRLTPSSLLEKVYFDEKNPYYICVKKPFIDDIVISHYAKSIEVVLCDGVEGSFQIDHQKFELQGKQVLYIPPNSVHSNNIRKGDGTIYVLKISAKDLQRYLDLENILETCEGASVHCQPFCCQEYDAIFQEISTMIEQDGNELLCLVCLLNIFRILSPAMKKSKQIKLTFQNSDKNRLLNSLITYTEEHFMNGLTNRMAAKYLGYNENYFCRWFSKMAGMTYNDYVMSLKIQYACKLLGEDYSVCEIVEKLGYTNASFFIKKFKQYTGYTPSTYSKMLKK